VTVETETPEKPPVSPLRKAMRVGCGCLLLFFGVAFFLPMLLIGYRDHERQRHCDLALGGQVAERVTVAKVDPNALGGLTVEILRTDETWINWSGYAEEISTHLKGGGQAHVVWTGSDTIGVLMFDREGRAVRHVCFVT
jgi:hypothetical protein